jgi:Na+-transporting methylmalonyl-CoA/oxaloacetate decarboxylase gamma subunit
MSIESIVFFFVLLFLSLLALAIRWLNERIRRQIAYRDLKDLFGPGEDTPEEPAPEKKSEPTRISEKPMPPIETPGAPASRKRRPLQRLPRLRTPADLRNGIILMTILGPCRALEHQREDSSTLHH